MAKKKKYVSILERGGFELTEEGARNLYNVLSGKVKTKGWNLPHDKPLIRYATEEEMRESAEKTFELFCDKERFEKLQNEPFIQKRIAEIQKEMDKRNAKKGGNSDADCQVIERVLGK
ncbi:MAG: hypothetical protein LBQ96_03720 [Fusobacteriaceae bacterium]|jgi:hypothetical protein|nr:hypothetical protein [Fusobacteriaceae bacterium]